MVAGGRSSPRGPEADALDHLLSESRLDCLHREQAAFDAVSAPETRDLVLFGAGRLGRRTLHALRRIGRSPVAFSDNARGLWGTTIDGVQVMSPVKAAAQFGKSATFVVTIWRAGGPHRYEHSRQQLSELGCRYVTSIAPLAWKYADAMLPHYCLDLPHGVLDQAPDVRRAFELLSDDRSRREFVAQLRFRLLADFDGLPHPDPEPQYLVSGLIAPNDEEVFVDAGAFDGDTLRSVLAAGRGFKEYVALEPDAANYASLSRYVEGLAEELKQRVSLLPLAAYSTRIRMRIEESGSASAMLVPTNDAPRVDDVECVPLDEICANRQLSFLKLDIEGAEPEAIEGARHVIARERPVIAMCVYHQQDHLWQLPLLVQSMADGYAYYLRPYNEEGWDLVCYAVPKERALMETGAQ